MSIKRRTILTRNVLCFMETAKIGTVSGTADANNMKQSNVSACIKEFEEQLKCRLFNRVRNGMHLTENGRDLYKIACDLENVLFKVENYNTLVHKVAGDVYLWISEGLGAPYLSACLPEFLAQYPDVHININCSIEPPKFPEEIDVSIVYEAPKKNDEVIISENMLTFGLFASMDYLSKYGSPKSLEDLLENHKICNRDNFADTWPEWNDFISKAKHVVTTTNSSSMLMRMTLDGIGIALHPVGIAQKEKDLIYLDQFNFTLSHPFWLVSRTQAKDLPKVRALIDYFKKQASQL